MREGVRDHPVMSTFVNAYHFTTQAENLMVFDCGGIILFSYSLFMAAYHMAVADFFIFPQLFPAGCTMYCEHTISGVRFFGECDRVPQQWRI